jgi:hypothetical protein
VTTCLPARLCRVASWRLQVFCVRARGTMSESYTASDDPSAGSKHGAAKRHGQHAATTRRQAHHRAISRVEMAGGRLGSALEWLAQAHCCQVHSVGLLVVMLPATLFCHAVCADAEHHCTEWRRRVQSYLCWRVGHGMCMQRATTCRAPSTCRARHWAQTWIP